MSFTVSFDASLKVKAGGIKGVLLHNARDVGMRNGVQVQHSNEAIDASRTLENQTYVFDGDSRKFRQAKNMQEIEDAFASRLSSVKSTLRKDAVVARGLILQLDPDFYKSHQTNAEKKRSYESMLRWAVQEFTPENLVCVSMHEDETNPHLHIIFTPVTQDGRLSQKDWFKNPSTLRKMHADLRNHMRNAGYDIDLQNRKPKKYAKRLSEREYKTYMQEKERTDQLIADEKRLEARRQALDGKALKLQEQEKILLEREQELQTREKKVHHMERVDTAEQASERVQQVKRRFDFNFPDL